MSNVHIFTGVDGHEGGWPDMDLAYLDAGSGSLIVQAVVGGVAGAAVAARLYWRRFVGRFRRGSADRD